MDTSQRVSFAAREGSVVRSPERKSYWLRAAKQ